MFFITSELNTFQSNICTHIDFPGHLRELDQTGVRTVGEYEIERFVGRAAILDVSHKMDPIRDYFDEKGSLAISPHEGSRMLAFLKALDELELSETDLDDLLTEAGVQLSDVRGVLFACGGTEFWRYASFESWQYVYFFNPFLSDGACKALVDANVSFVGVDAFQLEHPLINFRGDELPLVLNAPCREYVAAKLLEVINPSNHSLLLGNDIVIYENLRIPADLRGWVGKFAGPPLNLQLDGLGDNAPVRPYIERQRVAA
jgi:kynurenine formamidase